MAPLIILLLAAFVLMPYAPDSILSIFHHPIFSLIMIGALFYFTKQSPGLGVLALLAFGALYLERNRRTLTMAWGAPRMPQDREMPISPSLKFVPYETPSVSTYKFEPAGGCNANSNEWSSVGTSIDQKRVLQTVPPGAATWPVLARAFSS